MRALEARTWEKEQCWIHHALGHVYNSEVATMTVSFGLEEAKHYGQGGHIFGTAN